MATQFRKRLKSALEEFDAGRAKQLADEIHEAELAGYQLTVQEENLLERLLNCVQTYYRTMASL